MDNSSGHPPSFGSAASWSRLIAAIHPPGMLVAIGFMMGERAMRSFDPEDVWQDTLLSAWEQRADHKWHGYKPFRAWLLAIARHRVLDLVGQAQAGIRGKTSTMSALASPSLADSSGDHYAGPVQTTSPGRAEADRELAAFMERALAAVPDADHLRLIVRLRLFEEMTFEVISERIGIGCEAVRHRFRKGLDVYRRELKRLRLADSHELFPK